jgi:hypothetical protein
VEGSGLEVEGSGLEVEGSGLEVEGSALVLEDPKGLLLRCMCVLANMEKAARQITPPRKKITTTTTLKSAATGAKTLKAKAKKR